MSPTMLAVPDAKSLVAASKLQTLLPKFVALTLDAKQAHWNVTGAAFLPVHTLTDEFAVLLRTWTDRIAERAVALGMAVDARPTTVAASVPRPFPTGWVSDNEAIAELVGRIDELTVAIRHSASDLESSDIVAHDAVVEALEGLEKYRWMFLATSR
ncbi:MAG TPA: ferritin-like domain-containing protein [Ilumatobacteraceae bacterium]|nr:ferritin-like domain-containing protein [Ilumatobacteraceae bacterium]